MIVSENGAKAKEARMNIANRLSRQGGIHCGEPIKTVLTDVDHINKAEMFRAIVQFQHPQKNSLYRIVHAFSLCRRYHGFAPFFCPELSKVRAVSMRKSLAGARSADSMIRQRKAVKRNAINGCRTMVRSARQKDGMIRNSPTKCESYQRRADTHGAFQGTTTDIYVRSAGLYADQGATRQWRPMVRYGEKDPPVHAFRGI